MPPKKPKTTPKQKKLIDGVALYFGLPRDSTPILRSEVKQILKGRLSRHVLMGSCGWVAVTLLLALLELLDPFLHVHAQTTSEARDGAKREPPTSASLVKTKRNIP